MTLKNISFKKHYLLIADVNDFANFHVGDEAMLEANLATLRRLVPHATFTVISSNPEWTAQHYGVTAIDPFGFIADSRHDQRKQRLASILSAADKLLATENSSPVTDNMSAILLTLQKADGIIISGGGNLNSVWPNHLYERIALMLLASKFNKPLVVLGQTIGPELSVEDRLLLSKAIGHAHLVGVREKYSLRLAETLGVKSERLMLQVDDAYSLEPVIPSHPNHELPVRPNIVITLHPFFQSQDDDRLILKLAEQFDSIADALGGQFTFLPHCVFENNPNHSDADFGRRVFSKLKTASHQILDMCTSREAVWATSQADLIISTRYHPLVFATAQAIPGFGLYSDEYTYIKLHGALEHAGGEQWIMLLELAFTDLFPEAILELWSKRHSIRSQFENKRSEIQAMEATKEQRLAAALDLPNVPGGEFVSTQTQSPVPVSATVHQPTGAWAEISARVNKHLVDAMAGRSYYKLVSEEASRYALSLKAALDAKGQKPSIFKR